MTERENERRRIEMIHSQEQMWAEAVAWFDESDRVCVKRIIDRMDDKNLSKMSPNEIEVLFRLANLALGEVFLKVGERDGVMP